MKKHSTLSLMELAIMVLFFSLASALCLRAFVWSDTNSHRSEVQDHAVLYAQSAAEILKSTHGDPSATAELLNMEPDGNNLRAFLDQDWKPVNAPSAYRLYICPQDSGTAKLGQAAVSVYDEAGTLLFELPVCWQEVP